MILMKESEEDTSKWNNIPCSWIGKINVIKMSKLLKANYRFNAIPVKIPMAVFTELGKNHPKICLEPQRTPKANILRKKNKVEALHILISNYITKL